MSTGPCWTDAEMRKAKLDTLKRACTRLSYDDFVLLYGKTELGRTIVQGAVDLATAVSELERALLGERAHEEEVVGRDDCDPGVGGLSDDGVKNGVIVLTRGREEDGDQAPLDQTPTMTDHAPSPHPTTKPTTPADAALPGPAVASTPVGLGDLYSSVPAFYFDSSGPATSRAMPTVKYLPPPQGRSRTRSPLGNLALTSSRSDEGGKGHDRLAPPRVGETSTMNGRGRSRSASPGRAPSGKGRDPGWAREDHRQEGQQSRPTSAVASTLVGANAVAATSSESTEMYGPPRPPGLAMPKRDTPPHLSGQPSSATTTPGSASLRPIILTDAIPRSPLLRTFGSKAVCYVCGSPSDVGHSPSTCKRTQLPDGSPTSCFIIRPGPYQNSAKKRAPLLVRKATAREVCRRFNVGDGAACETDHPNGGEAHSCSLCGRESHCAQSCTKLLRLEGAGLG